jgi:putative MFS transporter
MTTPEPGPRDPYAALDAVLERLPVTPAHYKLLALVSTGLFFNVMEELNVIYAGPVLKKLWDLSQTEVNALITSTYLAMAVGCLVGGYLGDLVGRRRLFITSFAIFTIGALLAAVAPNYLVLVLARVVIGLGLGGEITLGATVIAEFAPPSRRGLMIASLNFLGGLGPLATSLIATLCFGPFEQALGGGGFAWRVYFGLEFLPALLLIWFRRYLPETPRYLVRRGEIAEANRVLSLLASGRLRGRDEVGTTEWIAGVDDQATWVEREHTRVSELFAATLRSRTLLVCGLYLCLASGALIYTSFVPALLVARGAPTNLALAFSTVANFVAVLGSLAGVVGTHRLRRRVSYFVFAGVMLPVVVALASESGLVATLVLLSVGQFMFQFLLGTNSTYSTELFPTRVRATGSGLATTVGQISGGIGPLVAGFLLDGYGSSGIFVLLGILFAAVALLVARAPETAGATLTETSGDRVARVRGGSRRPDR